VQPAAKISNVRMILCKEIVKNDRKPFLIGAVFYF